MFRPAVVSVATVALAAAAGSVAAIAQSGGGDPPGAGDPQSRVEPRTATIEKELAEKLGVFRRARRSEDALPVAEEEFFTGLSVQGGNPSLSRRAVAADGLTAYVLPANGAVCAIVTIPRGGSAHGCQDADQLGMSGASSAKVLGDCLSPANDTATPICKTAWVYEVVPDGVESVKLSPHIGATTTAAVEGNVYLVKVDLTNGDAVLSYKGPSATVSRKVAAPPSAAFGG